MEKQCGELQEFLTGALVPEYLEPIENWRFHWHECEQCQRSLPNAMEQLDSLVDGTLDAIRDDIQFIHGNYQGETERIVAEFDEAERGLTDSENIGTEAQDGIAIFEPCSHETAAELYQARMRKHAQLMMALKRAGVMIQGQLNFINLNWGLDFFHLVSEDEPYVYDSPLCTPLIASLPIELEVFIFESILAADVVGSFQGNLSGECAATVRKVIKHAAPEFLRRYLENEAQISSTQDTPTSLTAGLAKQLSAIPDRIRELAERIDDVGDSLKAGQMESIRLLERRTKRAVDFEPFLEQELGNDLYHRFSDSTQRDLQLAEYYFANNPEPDDYSHTIRYFHRAYEKEFRRRVLKPLIRSLVDRGHVNFSSEGCDRPLLVNRCINRSITLGQVLKYLERAPVVRDIVNGLGLTVDEIWQSGNAIQRARNDAEHGESCHREDAVRVRSMVLGENSILRLVYRVA